MVSQVTMPEPHEQFFREFATKTPDELSKVAKRLGEAGVTLSSIVASLDGVIENKRLATSALLAFSTWRVGQHLDVDAALDKLEEQFRGVDLTPLVPVLEVENLVTIAKSIDLSTAHDRVLDSARVITDMRPIFGEHVDKAPVAYAVGHQIELKVVRSGEVETLYVALDSSDLEELKVQIERAGEKQRALESVIEDRVGALMVDWTEEAT